MQTYQGENNSNLKLFNKKASIYWEMIFTIGKIYLGEIKWKLGFDENDKQLIKFKELKLNVDRKLMHLYLYILVSNDDFLL